MTDFRTTDQVQGDFHRVAEASHDQFTQVTDFATLQGLLTDDRLGEAAVYISGGGPVMYDLGILNVHTNPEWEGVNRFLNNTQLVSIAGRREIQQVQRDLQAADTDHDGILNNQELVAYAQAHTDRWANVAQFRNAAEVLLNRLPGYLAQTNLNNEQVAHFWGVMNHMAAEYDRLGATSGNRGTVYGLSLQGFPTTDQSNPPNLIRRLLNGTATPQELAAVHHVLETRMVDGQYQFQGAAPLSPIDVGMLGQILDRAAASGHSIYGMRLVAGDQETQMFAERNAAAQRCLDGTTTALRGTDPNALQTAFTGCATDMARLEGQNSDRIGARALLMRAYSGDLSPAETAILRRWMVQEAGSLGLTCDGTLDCMGQGAMQLVQGIARNPVHFFARNGVFMGGAYLFRRLALRNAFENRLNQACGGTGVANPRDAYRNYERYLNDQMRNSPMWRRFLNQLVRNPRRDGILGRAFINFPVTFLHLAAFNAVASRKDTGNTAVDILTDLPLIPLFEGMDAYDALNRSSIANFAAANPGACRPSEAAEPAPAVVPAPEQETNPAAQRVPLSDEALRAMSRDQVGAYVRGPYGAWTQPQFEEAMNGAPALTPLQVLTLPEDLRPVFDADLHWGAVAAPQVAQLRSVMPRTADLLVTRYAPNDPELAQMIREDIGAIQAVANPPLSLPEAEVTAGVRWALRQYIGNLQSGGMIRGSYYVSMIQNGGLTQTYMSIRASQECSLGCVGRQTSFADAARDSARMHAESLYNRLHPETWAHSSPSSSESSADLMMPRTADGRPIIFMPLPCGLAGGALSGASSLIRSLFGLGEAAGETAPAWGYGAAAFAGGA